MRKHDFKIGRRLGWLRTGVNCLWHDRRDWGLAWQCVKLAFGPRRNLGPRSCNDQAWDELIIRAIAENYFIDHPDRILLDDPEILTPEDRQALEDLGDDLVDRLLGKQPFPRKRYEP